MGNHRGGQQPRRVSRGVVLGVVAVVVVAALFVGWRKIRDAAADREQAAAASCVEGDATLVVAADPDIAEPLRTIAERYDATSPVVRDHCVTVVVDSVDTPAAAAALAGSWDESALGPRPALWIPQSSAALGTIAHEGDARSVATSPVVLATSSDLASALRAANIGWTDLPRLQADPDSLSTVGLPGWGSLRLALPDPAAGASLLAVEAVATAVASGPLTVDNVGSQQVSDAISRLVTHAASADGATLAALADAGGAAVHALPATERAVSLAGSATSFTPAGTPVAADYPAVELTGTWIDETQHRATDLFTDYLRQDEQTTTLSDNGFHPAATDDPALDVHTRIADAVTAASRGHATTVLIDVSSSMAERLPAVVSALRSYVASAPESSALGFWSYSKNLDGTTPYRDEVRTEPLHAERKTLLDQTLGALRTGTATRDQAYPTLVAAYKNAVANYVPGQTNSVLLVTDGPDDDSSLTGRALLDAIAAAGDPAKPVRVDVVAIGNGPSSDTLQQLADRTGGRLIRTAPADIPAALTTALN